MHNGITLNCTSTALYYKQTGIDTYWHTYWYIYIYTSTGIHYTYAYACAARAYAYILVRILRCILHAIHTHTHTTLRLHPYMHVYRFSNIFERACLKHICTACPKPVKCWISRWENGDRNSPAVRCLRFLPLNFSVPYPGQREKQV